MRVALVIAISCLALLPACRRPPAHAGFTPLPAQTAPKPDEEDEEEQEAPPPAPPPVIAPSAPVPAGEAGFTFGQTRREALRACTAKSVWRREGSNYSCTKPPVDPGFAGSPVLSFCDDRLCAIGIARMPEVADWATWDRDFAAVRDKLVSRYGEPTSSNEQIPEECKSDKFVECLDSGKAFREVSWKWDAHVVHLRMSKRKSGDGPSAIRFVSMPSN